MFSAKTIEARNYYFCNYMKDSQRFPSYHNTTMCYAKLAFKLFGKYILTKAIGNIDMIKSKHSLCMFKCYEHCNTQSFS